MFVPHTLPDSAECEALVVTCFDYRFQRTFERWIGETFTNKNYDRVSLGGGVKNWPVIFAQVELAERLHHIKRIIFINHEDCKAYGAESTLERHTQDLYKAREAVLAKFPAMRVELYYARLAGYLEPIK